MVMAILATNAPKAIASCIKRIRQRKLGKQRRSLPELSGYDLTPRILRGALKELAQCNCQIFSILAIGTGITPAVSPNVLYNDMASVLIGECWRRIPIAELIIDRRDDKRTRFQFDEYLKNRFGKKLIIRHEDSMREPALQAVDLVAYAIRQKVQYNTDEFYRLIQSKIIWEGIYQKQA